MATLYVENVPDDLLKALKEQAQRNRRSMAAEVISLLRQTIPTPEELRRRRKMLKEFERLRSAKSPGPGPFPSSEEMLREDRER